MIAFGYADYYFWEYGVELVGLYQFASLWSLGSLGALLFLIEFVLKKTKYLITSYLIFEMVIVFIFWGNMELVGFITTMVGAPFFLIFPILFIAR